MNLHKTKAFTLVELIIVITILAILATIGFMSYQSYTGDARDSSRITSLKTVYDGLTISYVKKQTYPIPDDYIDIVGVSKQGYVGDTVTKSIRGDSFKDPKDNTRYLYSLDYTGKKIELSGFLENKNKILLSQNNSLFVNQAFAGNIDYTSRYIYTIGNNVGILLNSTTNAPVNETISTGSIDLTTNTGSYTVIFADTGAISGSGQTLLTNISSIQNASTSGTSETSNIPSTPTTQTYTCTGLPTNASWNIVSSYTQTWDGTSWSPANSTATYNTTASTTSCNYTCNTGYTWDNTNCYKLACTSGTYNSSTNKCDTTISTTCNYTATSTNGLTWDNCEGGKGNRSTLSTYCSSKGMRLAKLSEVIPSGGVVPSCSGPTWTSTIGIYFYDYRQWNGSTIIYTNRTTDIVNVYGRCVVDATSYSCPSGGTLSGTTCLNTCSTTTSVSPACTTPVLNGGIRKCY
ncbi:MAG: type II secretion system protein [Candidatus Gracilibacteria bacterium]|nr:type II secretion system protein [Candidatus Gracilibacteria bacterium]